MRARVGVVVSGILLLAAVGCGGDDGGGDDLEAFCDELQAFSDDIADGDLESNRGLESLVDRVNELLELGGEDNEDAVTEVGEALADARPEDAEEVAELIQDELGDVAEDECDIDDFAEFEASDDGEDETTTTEPEGETTVPEGDTTVPPDAGELNLVTQVVDPATAGVEAGFEENIDLCFRGLMVACDDIFFGENGQAAAPDGSNARLYGGTCGGRILEFNNATQRCVDNLFAASPFDPAAFTDASFADLATACQGSEAVPGDLAACDSLFAGTGVGTVEEAYGDTCGGRIDSDVAQRQPGVSCVSIFGATAEFG
jgi:hypothetical protein